MSDQPSYDEFQGVKNRIKNVYQAPEIKTIHEDGCYYCSRESDIYSLGCIIADDLIKEPQQSDDFLTHLASRCCDFDHSKRPSLEEIEYYCLDHLNNYSPKKIGL